VSIVTNVMFFPTAIVILVNKFTTDQIPDDIENELIARIQQLEGQLRHERHERIRQSEQLRAQLRDNNSLIERIRQLELRNEDLVLAIDQRVARSPPPSFRTAAAAVNPPAYAEIVDVAGAPPAVQQQALVNPAQREVVEVVVPPAVQQQALVNPAQREVVEVVVPPAVQQQEQVNPAQREIVEVVVPPAVQQQDLIRPPLNYIQFNGRRDQILLQAGLHRRSRQQSGRPNWR